MTKEQAFNIGLPKWPQCIIKGETISEEQALNIIRRTDSFFYGFSGNNKEFNIEAYKIIKRPEYDNMNYTSYYNELQEWMSKWELINVSYLNNDWVSSSFIYGPHGWCHPNGTIEYHYNIGKYPEVENVYDDLVVLGKEFPFLNLTLTLMSGEDCESYIKPLVSMKLCNGIVEFIDTLSKEELTYEKTSIIPTKLLFSPNISYENYFSLEQIQKWANEVFKEDC